MRSVDRLSSLPEELQSRILSLMRTTFAVQTCVLSKRWRYTWMSITNLDFDDITPLGFTNLETFVDRVIGFCKSSQTESLRLNFYRTWIQGSSVSNWIDKAITLSVRELDIQYTLFELPSSLFTCTTLTKLKLCLGNIWECAPVVNLPCLKTLDIAVFTSSFAIVFKLIAGSPMLEDLSLKVVMHSGEEDFMFDIPTLKRLKLHLFRSENANKLILRVPKLEHLLFDGTPYSLFVIEWLRHRFRLKKNHLNMERLELKGFWHFELIANFLESSPELKEIYIEKLQGSRWIAPKLVPARMLAKLTTIEFLNFKWRKCDISFLKFLLWNANVLKTVTIKLISSSKGDSSVASTVA